jgi:hypothetical protein
MSGAQGEGAEDNTPDDIPDNIPNDNPESCIPPQMPEHLTSILSDIFKGKQNGAKLCGYKSQVSCTVRDLSL